MTEKVTAEDKVYYRQIDALKGIAIFLVILGHSIILYPIDLHQNRTCLFVFNWLSSVHMELFFTISGFCFSYGGSYREYLWKKVKRMMIPYLTFNLADMVLRSVFQTLVNRPRGMEESLKKMLLSGGEYWFLYTLFLIFLIFPPLYRAARGSGYRWAALLVLLLAARYCLPGISLFTLDSVIRYLFYFSIGVMIRDLSGGRIFERRIAAAKRAALLLALAVLWLALLRSRLPYKSIPAALTGIAVMYLAAQSEAVAGLFERFGRYSLQLYLFNGYFLVVSRTVIVSLLGVRDPFIIITFNMLMDFFLSYLVIKYLCERIGIVKVLMGIR